MTQETKPTKWWQWLLVYPIVLTSIVAAIPTCIEAYRSHKYEVGGTAPLRPAVAAKYHNNSTPKALSVHEPAAA